MSPWRPAKRRDVSRFGSPQANVPNRSRRARVASPRCWAPACSASAGPSRKPRGWIGRSVGVLACFSLVAATSPLTLGCSARRDRGEDAGQLISADASLQTDAGSTDGGVEPPTDGGPQACTKMDLVFVVDNSDSMDREQANLIANFPRFIELLDSYPDGAGQLDYRVAVTTTSRSYAQGAILGPPQSYEGNDGRFSRGGTCLTGRPWIERADGDVSATFSCVAAVGLGGPAYEMPLGALEMALSDRVADGTQAGFLREDALLAFVILTDEDDCSADEIPALDWSMCDPGAAYLRPVSGALAFLDELKGDRARWAAAVIAGDLAPQCSSDFGTAIEAQRLKQFVAEAGDNAVFGSICDGDLASALGQALDTFGAACERFGGLI